MRKWLFAGAAIGAIAIGSYTYLNQRAIKVFAAHHGTYTAEILVDHLPLSAAASIDWWLKNQHEILSKYHIRSSDDGGPVYITVFAFGDGYKEEEKKDRRCFSDVEPPKNCIDKDILMTINRTRSGETRFNFEYSSYLKTHDGKIVKTDD
ncbi:hypothetical protein CLM71_11715 [Serratia sp. MYb239]|uniref:DUF943 family protein n=1 Tax=Serratia sp. MYb239 TaxID=2033438 RepID=UPI000CF67655|nr:DUF943 family protein [Serratia sp. MYb239]AVJ17752.1 hypothetical protein CLM71_11715 [Serratia sp. MYb239]MCA4824420.1 DUF943 family protein [Serratia rubidaea]QPT11380.1 DUF943 family protein [Serratia rubidaea]SQJ19500.1 Enterobacterial putative membrane protein (DUF943) [Serratia rubidaea]